MKTLYDDLQEVFQKHDCKGYAYALAETRNTGSGCGYGVFYPSGTEEILIKKLKIMISDIEKSMKGGKRLIHA